jgi:hypothetical protein
MKTFQRLGLICLVVWVPVLGLAHQNTLLEGYYRITLGEVPVGYSVTRYGFNPIRKQFETTVFTLTQGQGGSVIESIEAVSTEDFAPVRYSFTSVVGKKTSTIDAKVVGGKMQIQSREDGKLTTSSFDLPKGSFLSAFLVYVILKSPDGLKDNSRYEYQAIAEETGKLERGVAVVEGREIFEGQEVFRIKNSFMGTDYFSLVTAKGEILETRSPKQAIRSRLVSQGRLAYENFDFPEKTIRRLFGEIPQGRVHPLAAGLAPENIKERPAEVDSEAGAGRVPGAGSGGKRIKGQGIPGGQGVHLKKGGG